MKWYEKLFKLTVNAAMDAVLVHRHAMRAQLEWWMARPCCCGMITVTDWAPVRFSHFSSGRGESSALAQWPVQLRLVPVKAPYFDGAKLLIAADCCAYAYAAFHRDFIAGHTTVIGCPKLDEADYKEKLTAILAQNEVKSVTVVRMEVPCCGGIERAVKEALKDCGKMIPWRSVTLSLKGKILEDC